jgi:hypothetical protein
MVGLDKMLIQIHVPVLSAHSFDLSVQRASLDAGVAWPISTGVEWTDVPGTEIGFNPNPVVGTGVQTWEFNEIASGLYRFGVLTPAASSIQILVGARGRQGKIY